MFLRNILISPTCILILLVFCIFRILYLEYLVSFITTEMNSQKSHIKPVGSVWSATPEPEPWDTLIIYNRVPKTGSTSFVNMAYDLCRKRRFNVLHVNVTGNSHVLSMADQYRFVNNVTKWRERRPALYHGHFGYIDFQQFGSKEQPLYVNILRKPLDRLVSYYYFLRYGDDYRPHLIRKKHGDKKTFDECVQLKHADCSLERMWLQVPFMCGQASACWVPGNAWALQKAKENLVSKYLLVGVTEELTDFVSLLEAALPNFFRGASDYYLNSNRSHLRRTNQKFDPSEETIKKIQESKIWQLENELYEFAREQFHFVKKHNLIFNKIWNYDVDIGKQFRYEKIYPKP